MVYYKYEKENNYQPLKYAKRSSEYIRKVVYIEVYNIDSEVKTGVLKMVIVAKQTIDGKLYVGKRDVKMYDKSSKLTDEMVKHANAGLTLDAQRSIRDAVAVKNGIKKITSGGKAVDLSNIDSV